jgi:hypothetical protein
VLGARWVPCAGIIVIRGPWRKVFLDGRFHHRFAVFAGFIGAIAWPWTGGVFADGKRIALRTVAGRSAIGLGFGGGRFGVRRGELGEETLGVALEHLGEPIEAAQRFRARLTVKFSELSGSLAVAGELCPRDDVGPL